MLTGILVGNALRMEGGWADDLLIADLEDMVTHSATDFLHVESQEVGIITVLGKQPSHVPTEPSSKQDTSPLELSRHRQRQKEVSHTFLKNHSSQFP